MGGASAAVAQAMRYAGCLNRRSLGVSDVFPHPLPSPDALRLHTQRALCLPRPKSPLAFPKKSRFVFLKKSRPDRQPVRCCRQIREDEVLEEVCAASQTSHDEVWRSTSAPKRTNIVRRTR